jgi:hypothetical protein
VEGSAEVLLVVGTLVLTYGFLLGIPFARARMKGPSAPRSLVNNHLEAMMGGSALIALSLAAGYSTLDKGFEQVAAWLLAIGVVAAVGGGTLNWLMKTEDAFAEKPPGFYLQSASGPAISAGGVLMSIGVLMAL